MALIETDCCTPAINIMTGLQHFPFFWRKEEVYRKRLDPSISIIHRLDKRFFFGRLLPISIWAGASSFSRFFSQKFIFLLIIFFSPRLFPITAPLSLADIFLIIIDVVFAPMCFRDGGREISNK